VYQTFACLQLPTCLLLYGETVDTLGTYLV